MPPTQRATNRNLHILCIKLTHLKTRWNQLMKRSTVFSFQFILVRRNRSLMSCKNYSQGGLGIPDLKAEASQQYFASKLIGTLRSNDADGNENVKKPIGFISKQQLCTCITLFCTFLCSFLYDYDVDMPNLAFYRVRKQATEKFYFSFCTWIWSLGIQLQVCSPTFDKVSG